MLGFRDENSESAESMSYLKVIKSKVEGVCLNLTKAPCIAIYKYASFNAGLSVSHCSRHKQSVPFF